MVAKSPSETNRVFSVYGRRLTPRPPSTSSSSSALPSFALVLSHGSDIEAVARSAAAPPLLRLAVETGASR